MRQSGHLKVRAAETVATAFLICTLLFSIPVHVLLAQEANTGNELLSYPGTSLGGLTSAQARMSLDECRKLCNERQGCLGFDHHTPTNQCRLFAAVGNARQDPASNSGTRSLIAGYRPPTPPIPEAAAPYDPMGTVTSFYSALSAADGETASAHVVPEKRGRGPFNVVSLQSFFGAMSKPLTLTGTALRSRDEVRVSYEYVTDQGRRCRGRADVTTVYRFGKTLISRIKALDGC